MTTLDDFVRRRTQAADAVLRVCDRLDGVDLVPHDRVAALRGLARRTRDGRFVVFLVGCFSSGKSTLLNALLGAAALPVKVNPCTAILTEVVHADTPRVEVHFKPKAGEETGRIEVLSPEAFLARYQLTTSEDTAGAEADDRFGDVTRAVVGYPLPLLANGVVLLDTPGLDDDPRRTARTLSSLPDADAVIFALSANRFLTDLERRTLTRDLLPLGLTNLFFPVTMVDLLENLTDDPVGARRQIEVRGREFLGPVLGDDFDRRFFLLDARTALHARWDRDARAPRDEPDGARLAASGILPFEDTLETFLVEERGAVQLRSLQDAARRLREDLERRAALDRATAADSVEELRRRQTELEPSLRQLEAIARRVERTVDAFVERQGVLVWQDLRAFVVETEALLPDAVAGFDLGDLAGFDLFTPKGRSRVEAAIHQALEAWLDERMGTWQSSLRPRIERSLQELRAEIAADADDFDALAARIVTDFAGGALAFPDTPAAGEEPSPAERWFSVAMGAILLSPGTMAAGWADGYEGAMKGAAGRLGVRLAILALGALLGPVGWAGIVLYAVTDAVLVVLTGGSRLRRVREGVAEALKGKLVAQVDAARADIARRVREGLSPLRDGLVAAARSEAEELKGALERTISAREQLQRDASRRSASWERVLAAFAEPE